MQISIQNLIEKSKRIALGFSVISFAILSGCTRSWDLKSAKEVWLPWQDKKGSFEIQKVKVETVKDWSPLRGSAVQIRSHFKMLTSKTFSSEEVTLEYSIDDSGAIVPLTEFSTEMASLYAHFERLQKLDRSLALPAADSARRVYVNFLNRTPSGGLDENNAYYASSMDSFFVVPYRLSGLPLSVNGGILAHEHFHSIFARLLLQPLSKTLEAQGKSIYNFADFVPHSQKMAKMVWNYFDFPIDELKSGVAPFQSQSNSPLTLETMEKNRNYFVNMSILRGVNEGLADVWAWFYTGDPCFMGHSFDRAHSVERCLDATESLRLMSVQELGDRYNPWQEKEAQAESFAYTVGTSLARMIYLRILERGELHKPEAIHYWTQRIVDILPSYLPNMLKVFGDDNKQGSVLAWEKMVDSLVFGPGSPQILSESCKRWTGILNQNQSMDNFMAACPQ